MSRSDCQGGAPFAPSLYVNYFEVAQNPLEFLLELGQYRPARGNAPATVTIHTYTAMSPSYAKLLSELLAQALSKHEEEYGSIAIIPAAGSGRSGSEIRTSKSPSRKAPPPPRSGPRRRTKPAKPP